MRGGTRSTVRTIGRCGGARVVARWLAAGQLVLGVVACRAITQRIYTPPRVDFRGVHVDNVGIDGASVRVLLAVRNPNVYSLTARQGLYRLMIADSVEVGRGLAGQPVTVAGKDSALVQLPLQLTWKGLGRAGRAILGGAPLDYRVVGEMVVQTPLGSRSVPFDERGTFEAKR